MQPNTRSALPPLFAYLAAVLVGGALLAPLLFDLGKWAQSWLTDSAMRDWDIVKWLLSEIERAHFTRYFNRAVLVLAIVIIWPLLKAIRLDRSVLPAFAPVGSGIKQGLTGSLLAAGLLFGLGLLFIQNGIYTLKPDAAWLKLSAHLTAAFGAGIVEELFFRGALLGILLRTMKPKTAFFWCTFIFAIVHFLRPPGDWQLADADVRWHSGFAVLTRLFSGFGDWRMFIAEFLTLVAVGAVLAAARLRTGRLWLPIGLHAGWVFGLKYFTALTLTSDALNRGETLPWIGANLKIGLAPLATVVSTGWLAARVCKARSGPR
ncbi:MAG: CPBP family intramembrane metalloprotease [Verrucomicrobiaceae bacterium]|nr:CPBP family intramembrane metalloprotease [Verrucomicrobiaceae bacterium]